MTPGQERALKELERIQAIDPDALEVGAVRDRGTFVDIDVTFRIGLIETRHGGLALRERETFTISIAQDYPFTYPTLFVAHERFKGFPHVTWIHFPCLYQSALEWNPADGLFGYFDRLRLWLTRAALNEMDPVEGPLEPPHHATSDGLPIVIRADAPAEAGQHWAGWAEINRQPNFLDLVGWHAFGQIPRSENLLALTVVLPKAMPMEFPQTGGELFAAFTNAGLDRGPLLELLLLSAMVTKKGQPAYLVLGFPMRRAVDGTPRQHFAVWSTDPEYADSLRLSVPEIDDSDALKTSRARLLEAVYKLFEVINISWTRVLEDRDEILVRRDHHTAAATFRGARVLLLGCGALGSWAAEFIARAKPECLDLVDNRIVKPGLLVRQNFSQKDIGCNKAQAMSRRIRDITHGTSITSYNRDAHRFLTEDLERAGSYDLIVDCTASILLQMKLERDWSLLGPYVRRFYSLMLDVSAQHCIAIALQAQSADGPWSAYVRLKYTLCAEAPRAQLAAAFYDPAALGKLFQPEPGCSDPTFSGSALDASNIAATALTVFASRMQDPSLAQGAGFSLSGVAGIAPAIDVLSLAPVQLGLAGSYRVLLSHKALNQARAAVRQHKRLRSASHETGGLLWGYWDDAAQVIIILDASGPPPDSKHDPGHFVCGTAGTQEEHGARVASSRETCRFVGLWHTHPDFPPEQSPEDMGTMSMLVSQTGQRQRRAVMLIFGRVHGAPNVGLYVYESQAVKDAEELLKVGSVQIPLERAVV